MYRSLADPVLTLYLAQEKDCVLVDCCWLVSYKYRLSAVSHLPSAMASPDGFPSPSEHRSPETMAIEDSPAEAADVPIPTEVATPSERSRSDVRERSLAERRTVQSGVVASHRGFEPFASREGLPQNPNHPGGSATMNQAVLLQQLQQI